MKTVTNSSAYFKVRGMIVDIVNGRMFQGEIEVCDGKITSLKEKPVSEKQYIMPGFVDSHVHIESSMMIPAEFGNTVLTHGTTGIVADPHEIANVMGLEGIEFMIGNSRKTPLKIYFSASSCVPATTFETAGAELGIEDIEFLLAKPEIVSLAEVMNYPGVLANDRAVLAKIAAAQRHNKPVDGHAPGLRGEESRRYIAAGITTDHESTSIEEAEEKISYGMKILIREGSATGIFDALIPLLKLYPDSIMFCTDDIYPGDLMKGHINLLVKRGIDIGYDIMDVLRAASYNPVKHYQLDIGLLQEQDKADFIIVDDLKRFKIISTYLNGKKETGKGNRTKPKDKEQPVNNFCRPSLAAEDIKVKPESNRMNVIEAYDGNLFTGSTVVTPHVVNGEVFSDPAVDILKVVVVNRYFRAKPVVAFVRGFGLKRGAIASTVAHDSHNIIATGVTDKEILQAIEYVALSKGGLAVVSGDKSGVLPLPFAGLMSAESASQLDLKYSELTLICKESGCILKKPLLTLSFLALPVIPELKITDKGLFDANTFSMIKLFR